MIKKISCVLFSILFIKFSSFAQEQRADLKKQFLQNQSLIYTINIRNFGAKDKNNNGIIEVELGDERGSFLNAREKLFSLKSDGINTIYVLPITPVGKLKALGTAGSLYAMDSFNKINPQLKDLNSPLTLEQEAIEFINEAHKIGLNVIVDLPSCASYDLAIKKPSWMILDKNNEPLIPADWTDVRLFKIYDENGKLNKTTLENFKSFVDMVQGLGFDGIRADVAAIKPKEFWNEIISYSKIKNPNFLFIAEASPRWTNPALNGVKNYSSIDELLSSGFDGYYGSFSDFKNVKTKKEFDKIILENLQILKKNKSKALMLAFATHDQQAPILKGKNYWNMILWLNILLPGNSYFLDGFSFGDDFTYEYENKKAPVTYTDDEIYFVHSGMFDIFNFSSEVQNKHPELKRKYLNALNFKNSNKDFIKNSDFKLIQTKNDKVFGFKRKYKEMEIIVLGSLDEQKNQDIQLNSNYLKNKYLFSTLSKNKNSNFKIEKNTIKTTLEPLELQAFLIKKIDKK